MKNLKLKRVVAIAASVIMASAMTIPAMAATSYSTVAGNNHGKYSYVSKMNSIYKVNMETRKFKKIKTFKGVTDIHNISYKSGYLYFVLNRYKGSDMTCDTIYRMKTTGSALKKLATGSDPVIMGKKIYYLPATKHGKGGGAYTTVRGINRMSLNGTSKKKLLVSDQIIGFACASGRIRYQTSDDIYTVKTIKTDGTQTEAKISWQGNSPLIYSNTNKLLLAYPSSTYYEKLIDGKSEVGKINDYGYVYGNIKSIGCVGNYGFYRSTNVTSTSSSGNLYMCTAKENAKLKKVKHLTNGFPVEVLAVNRGSIVLCQTYKKTNKYAISVMKTSGKGYRVITRYYHW